MIFIDSNIPMYLVGGDHPNRQRSREIVEASLHAAEGLVTDAEVLQEILHRYSAIGRQDAIEPALEVLLSLVDEVFPVTLGDVRDASEILRTGTGLSARDALHVAIMRRHDVASVLSFDRGFDQVDGLRRLA